MNMQEHYLQKIIEVLKSNTRYTGVSAITSLVALLVALAALFK